MVVSRRQLAEIIGVHEDSVRRWVKAGCPVAVEPPISRKGIPNDARGRKFDSAAVIRWLLEVRWYRQ